MTPEQWQQVKELFHEAAELPAKKRMAWVQQNCNGDAELLRELQLLLESHEEAEHFIEKPALVSASEILPKGDDSWCGQSIGHYRVLREIGRGGMGIVLLAVRDDEQFTKQVAIKLLRRGMDTEDILRRFRNERQIIASLEHPDIARLLDGGTTEDGLPYFVLEYIEGAPLDRYCDEHRLPTLERLQLFRRVCAAVQYAHQNLIVHRDLKPSNILVTFDGEPKLLDFGIAKLLNPELTAFTIAPTATQARLMTPDYASPEQIRGGNITTASDVYSLGVLLYRLLTGHSPYRFTDSSPREIERLVCESEPQRPSIAVSRVEEIVSDKGTRRITPESVSKTHDEKPDALRRKLKGDLDNIVLMAMRKEPERRYSSAAQLGDDIRRYEDGLPLMARKDTRLYRTSKFIGRNKLGVASAGLILAILLGGIIATIWQAAKANQQARLAQAKSNEAQQALSRMEKINTFMQSIFSYGNPQWFGRAGGRSDMTVAEAMRDVETRVDTEFANEPEIRADVHQQMGDTYRSQIRLTDAERNLREALRLRLQLFGEDNAKVAESLYILSGVRFQQGDLSEQENLLARALTIQRRHPDDGNNLPYMMVDYAGFLFGYRGDFTGALALDLEALEQFRRRYGESHYMVVETGALLVRDNFALGDYARAEALARDVLKSGQEPESFHMLNYLARVQILRGEYQAADLTLKQMLAQAGAPDTRPEDAKLIYGIQFFMAYRRGDNVVSNLYIDKILALLPSDDANRVAYANIEGANLSRLGHARSAENLLRSAVAKLTKPANQVSLPLFNSALGESLTAQHRFQEAETLLLDAYYEQAAHVLPQEYNFTETRQRLVELYRAWGKADEAKKYE